MNNFERFIIGDCTIIRHTNFTFRAVFGRDKDNTVSTTVSIYGTRSCIFKDRDIGYIRRMTILMLCSIPSTRIRGLEEFNVPTPRML